MALGCKPSTLQVWTESDKQAALTWPMLYPGPQGTGGGVQSSSRCQSWHPLSCSSAIDSQMSLCPLAEKTLGSKP